MTLNPYASSSVDETHRTRSPQPSIVTPVVAWIIAVGTMLLHAFILGIGVVGKSIPQAWVGPILLGAIIASFIFSITGTAFIRRPMLARIICGLALLPCLFYVFIIVVVVFFFDLPAQD